LQWTVGLHKGSTAIFVFWQGCLGGSLYLHVHKTSLLCVQPVWRQLRELWHWITTPLNNFVSWCSFTVPSTVFCAFQSYGLFAYRSVYKSERSGLWWATSTEKLNDTAFWITLVSV
jgi:hypothetical protein